MSLLDKLNAMPPFMVRLLAREHRGEHNRGLSHEDIAERSGLSRSTVATLSFKTSWEGIPVDTADKFCRGCGVDLLHPKPHRDFLVRRQLGTFILRATNSKKLMYRKLFRLLDKWVKPKSPEPSAG